ncbi:LacI family DNA-binding transcriptional regulator [Caldinitratiruptor microaerophilus]|uniref:LacI family transcriptional regulator n=1 Tax=Caldinitratiruptor microaerophilus TaxID=671077 RepID=A0AA35G770_9FIRM|nr:LacI family DNA-binding transcriptional regulator [Caldinitratiruptor microaerophilus]BDG62356.1 LacI family transcriptional regulator [Caldinitratiruptor microaerophilus]
MAATIRDVARAAGVSQSTVSRALNGSGYVSPATRARVLAAAAQLHFRPSHVARSLVSKATHTLGLLLPDITNPFFPAIARGVEDAAARAGYAVILCNTDRDPAHEEHYLAILRQRQVDGLVLIASSAAVGHRIARADFPAVVFVDRVPPGAEADAVVVDNREGVRTATRHLLGLGHRRIAFVGGSAGSGTSEDRLAGYLAALAEAGLNPDPGHIRAGDFTYDGGYAAGRALLGSPDRPTAVVAANDLMAIGVLRAAAELGLRVPDDVAVVGYDDIPLAGMLNPPLTTVAQPTYEMGERAARMLLERLAGKAPPEPRRVVLPARLVVRRSCGAGRDGQ